MTAKALPYAEVIGDPIDHSLSPLIHGFWLEKLGIEAEYRRHRVERGELRSYIGQRQDDADWRGCNVTMPLKLDALTIADDATDRAFGAGAANIIVPRDGKLIAGNTDVGGVMAVLGKLVAAGGRKGLITLLGSGGAARAALMALRLMGIASVRLQSRNLAEAYNLAVQFRLHEEPRPFHMAIEGDGLINATPLGMAGAPKSNFRLDALRPGGWVFDFVTSPQPTELIRQARERGLAAVDGVEMLVEQAAESFGHFFGAEPPREHDDQLMARLRS